MVLIDSGIISWLTEKYEHSFLNTITVDVICPSDLIQHQKAGFPLFDIIVHVGITVYTSSS